MSSNSIVERRRNSLISTWDTLFDTNPKEWIGFKPSLGEQAYACYSCRHIFLSRSSFEDHVNRRIMVLKYNCNGCMNRILTFYNRCSFLLHTRTHYTLDQGEINLCELDIFPLPVALAGFLPHPNIPMIFSGDQEDIITEDVYVNTQFYTPDINQRGQQIIVLKPYDIIFKQDTQSLVLNQVCRNIPKCEFITLECQKMLRTQHLFAEENNNETNSEIVEVKQEPEENVTVMTMPIISKVESLQEKILHLPRCLECNVIQKGTMAEHYQGNDRPTNGKLKCTTCRFIASTECSLKAHIRLHRYSPPYVCPDCGKDFQNWVMLKEHMDEVCFHLAKHVRFRCPGKKCGKLFAMPATFANHFQVHIQCLLTCSICHNIFFKKDNAEEHRKTHLDPCTFKRLYNCSLCKELGTLTHEIVEEHINLHTTDTSGCMYVYMCKYCRGYFRSTTTYATHLLKCSIKHSKTNLKKSDSSKYITGECESCHNKLIFTEEKHIKFCNKCQSHERKTKSGGCKRYFCVLCNTEISMDERYAHMDVCKYSKPVVNITKLNIDDLESLSFSSTSSDMDSSSPSRFRKRKICNFDAGWKDDDLKRKKRKIYINHNKVKKPAELDLTADEPVQFDGTYYCKLCNYKHTERAEFHDHIKSHRDISTAYQCMECAECFVVKPSLIKHLVHFHNISDHESYLKENDCYDVEALKELAEVMKLAPGESKEPVKENQCRVCRKQFDDPVALSKHFRIHGMAFLLRNAK